MSGGHFLKVSGLSKSFEGLKALEAISLVIKKGRVHSLIGPNGAGKTTFFNCITGMTKPGSGSIHFLGTEISGLKPHKIARFGLARTFQNIRLFSEMSVLENVMVGQYIQTGLPVRRSFFGALFQTKHFKEDEEAARDRALHLLEFVGIVEDQDRLARHLPYGDQRRLEIARALASRPALLLLDEPAAGMNPQETADLMQLITKIQTLGITPFLIEHNMHMVMGISDHIVVLDHGEKIAEGRPEDIRKDKSVIAAYLGGGQKKRKKDHALH